MHSNIWFSPLNVIHYYNPLQARLPPEERKSRAFKKATEAYHVAVMLVGMIDYQGIEYWMQLVEDKEGSPDIRTARYARKNDWENWFEMQEVEVVEYEKHATTSLPEFLLEKKLAETKGYDELTTILCRVNRTMKLLSYRQIHGALENSPISSPVIILSKIHPHQEHYQMCQVHPFLDLLHDFDVPQLLKTRQYRGVLRVRRSGKKELRFVRNPREKHFPLETLGL